MLIKLSTTKKDIAVDVIEHARYNTDDKRDSSLLGQAADLVYANYEKGGKIPNAKAKAFLDEIAEYQELLKSNAPQDEKGFAKEEIADLKKQLAELEREPVKKAPSKKQTEKEKQDEITCQELREAWLKRREAARTSAHKSELRKSENAIERTTDGIIHKAQSGELTNAQIIKLIEEFEASIKILKQIVNKSNKHKLN